MTSFLFGGMFALLTLFVINLQQTYNHIPVKELRRRARHGDELANLLYRPVSYGLSLRVLLWGLIIGTAALCFVLLARTLDTWLAVILVGFLIGVGFYWLPSSGLNGWSIRLTSLLTPVINRLLMYVHRPLAFTGRLVRRYRHLNFHTGLYDKDDLVELLHHQADLTDNRITAGDIDLLLHVLQFGDKQVRDALIPLRHVQLVNADDLIGPQLMDELYQSGHSRFPVYEKDTTNIVATLYLRDLVGKVNGGAVRTVMRPDVFFVHEDFTLQQALQAFLKTKHHLFIVVNSFEEFVGVLTIEDILEQVIGQPIVDEFDKYDDLRAVAETMAAQEHSSWQKAEQEPSEKLAGETEAVVVK